MTSFVLMQGNNGSKQNVCIIGRLYFLPPVAQKRMVKSAWFIQREKCTTQVLRRMSDALALIRQFVLVH